MTTVYVVPNGRGNNGRKMHTDPECHYLRASGTIVEKDRSVVENHLDICKGCAGTRRNETKGNPRDTRNLLSELNPEDIGLSPLQQ